MIEALVGICAILMFVLVMFYIDHRRAGKTKHAH